MKDNQIVKADGGPEFPLTGNIINLLMNWLFDIGQSYYLSFLMEWDYMSRTPRNFDTFGDLVAAHYACVKPTEACCGDWPGNAGYISHGEWVYSCSSFGVRVAEDKVTFYYHNGKAEAVIYSDYAVVTHCEPGHSYGRLVELLDILREHMPVSEGEFGELVPVWEPDTPHFMFRMERPPAEDELVGEVQDYRKAYPALRPYMAWHGKYVGTVHCYNVGYYTRKGDPRRSRVARRRSRSLRLARRLKSETTER
jgi:hypothetical protein